MSDDVKAALRRGAAVVSDYRSWDPDGRFTAREQWRIRGGIYRWLASERPGVAELIDRGDLSLCLCPDGDEGGVAWWLRPDEEAHADIREEWARCTTSYRHPDGRMEAYL